MGLQLVEIIMAVEREFGIEVPDTALATFRRVGDLHAIIVTALSKHPSDLRPEVIWLRLRDLVAEHLGVPPERITPDADFIQDLRAG